MARVAPAVALGIVLAACGGDDATTPGGGEAGDAGGTTSGGTADGGATTDAGTTPPPPSAAGWKSAFDASGKGLRCAMTKEEMASAPSLTFGDATIVVGYEQLGNNQDPLVVRYDGATQTYCQHHEREPPDGRALGISWDGGPVAYVVYTIVGGGSALDTAAKGGWLESYGRGGGPKVSVIGAIDAAKGTLTAATFVIAKKNDGGTNTHTPTSAPIRRDDGRIELRGSSAFQPVNPDRTPMTCTDYPFDTRYVFSADLRSLECSSSTSCTAKTPCP